MMRQKTDDKKQSKKNQDVISVLDTSVYALAGYMAEYVALLRHTTVKRAVR